MVGCSLRHLGEELLGLGGGLDAYLEQGAVFGIPLLYPWANRLGGWSYEAAGRSVVLDPTSPLLHGEEHALPIHGALAATSDWVVTGQGSDKTGAWLESELDFALHPDLLEVFPFPHRLELSIRLRRAALELSTRVIADRGAPVPLSSATTPTWRCPAPRARTGWSRCRPATRSSWTSASSPAASPAHWRPASSCSARTPSTTSSRSRAVPRSSASPAVVAG